MLEGSYTKVTYPLPSNFGRCLCPFNCDTDSIISISIIMIQLKTTNLTIHMLWKERAKPERGLRAPSTACESLYTENCPKKKQEKSFSLESNPAPHTWQFRAFPLDQRRTVMADRISPS